MAANAVPRGADGGIRIGSADSEQIERRNRELLERELLEGRLTFASQPYHAHVQFSNFCNMSCVMCWDGGNPPLKRMAPEVLGKLAEQIAPSLSVITPHDGSEPLLVGWEEARELAADHGIRLALTTNAQFLDDEHFEQAKDVVESIVVSVDSHVPEIYERIRVGSHPEKVFENVARVAPLCEEHGIEAIAQAVFMTPNAPMMPDTIAFMADRGFQTVNVIQMIDANGRSGYLDPTIHFSSEWIAWIKERCVAVAREKQIRLGWQLAGREWLDFRDQRRKIAPHPAKVWDQHWEEHMRLLVPGFCKHVAKSLRITTDGDVAPCAMATGTELRLGNLSDQDHEEIWNGPAARDLRRAHYTWDYPSLCKTCRFSDTVGPQRDLPFMRHIADRLTEPARHVTTALHAAEPAHMTRTEEAPVIIIERPDREVARYVVGLAVAGAAEQAEWSEVAPRDAADGLIELPIPSDLWERQSTNLGLWWALFALCEDGRTVLTSSEARCVIRHRQLPRVSGSDLTYPDQGRAPATYLGKAREVGWTERDHLPERPRLRARRNRERRRFRAEGSPAAGNGNGNGRMSRSEYDVAVVRVHVLAESALPPGADVLVISKGDEQLLDLGHCAGHHFPAGPDGGFAGFHPRDGSWAVEHLEELRDAGAEYLLIPRSAFWWFEHYPEFTAYLRTLELVARDDDAAAIYDLRSSHLAVTDPTAVLVSEADRLFGEGGQHRRFWQRFHPDPDSDELLPRFAVAADGYELVDSSGRTYVDWVSGGGPVLLGYRHPAVEEAVTAHLAAGPTLSLPHPVQVDVAKMLVETIPCAEMVAFGKNGSDAVTGAVRIARAVTGRETILQFGMHGFHDWHVAVRPRVLGVPEALRSLVHPFPYNNLAALEELFDRFEGEVAAVVMEPMRTMPPQPGYLEAVRDLAHGRGALLVFDEMVTGFRMAKGGAQELYGVTPDIGCFGKALSNGMPLSVVAGKREYMEQLPRIAFGMTFRGETLSLAAARAVLETLRDEPVTGHLIEIGQLVRAGFERACAAHGIRGSLRGPECRMSFHFEHDGDLAPDAIKALFLRECLRNGVFTNGDFLPTYAHDAEAVERTERAFDHAMAAIAALRDGR